jgi:membrane-associated phospholipid phosphatase
MKRFLFTAFYMMIFAQPIAAEAGDSTISDSVKPDTSHKFFQQPVADFGSKYWLGYLSDSRDLCTGFLHWGAGEWVATGLIAGSTVGLFFFDDEIQQAIQRNRTSEIDMVSRIAKPFGDGRVVMGSMAGAYLLGWGLSDTRLRNTARYGFESYLISGAITTILKYSLHRHRPSAHDGPYHWDGISFDGDNESFPSGHSTAAFAIAGSIAGQYPDNWLVGGLSYAIATMVALSRLNDHVHWASDALVGSTIGWVTARTVALAHREKAVSTVNFRLLFVDDTPGLAMEYSF